MKNTVKIIMVVFMTGICSFGYAQNYETRTITVGVPIHNSYYYETIQKQKIHENLPKVLDMSFSNVPQGSRVAIDEVTVSCGVKMSREELEDKIIDVLLGKGYKVFEFEKERLEKLYLEQQIQQNGTHNDKTSASGNNFSLGGYYIKVKLTETSLRVQVVNISTGEYEGNATITF